MNRGTKEGESQEKEFVINFNKGNYEDFSKQHFSEQGHIVCVHVSTNQPSNTSNVKVKPKSDAYLVSSKDAFNKLLSNDFYYDEATIESYDYTIISNSGISIKMKDSKKYQIHKFTLKSFIEVFKNKYLGCAIMLYTKNSKDFIKNEKIFERWETNESSFLSYFNDKLVNNKTLKDIQKYSINEVKKIITNDLSILELIYTGKGIFQDPYYASYSYINDQLGEINFSDFNVTTGSGRLKTPTIVIKPR